MRRRTKHNYLNFFLSVLDLNCLGNFKSCSHQNLVNSIITSAQRQVKEWQNNKSYKNLCSKEKENPIGSGCLESQLSINSRTYQFYQVDELRIALTFFSRSKFTSDLISLNMISNDCIFLLRHNIQSLQIQEYVWQFNHLRE